MIVVSDTTIISNLFQTDLLFILPALYQDVIIPNAVATELERLDGTLPGAITWLQVRTVTEQDQVAALQPFLDLGESEAIVLAQELRADWLLMDEQRGRQFARQRHLNLTGTLDVLLAAKRASLIPDVKTPIQSIQQRAGAWYQTALVQEVLRQASELTD